MPAEAPVIEFERVSLAFASTPVLEDVSLQVGLGETKVLLGEAGAGKSVILKLAIGLLRPDAGQVNVFGLPMSKIPERDLFEVRRRIGMVFQESALFDSMSVRDNVAYRLDEEGKLDSEAIEDRVRACLDIVDLAGTEDKFPAELSGGMQRRVSIARALSTEPEVMLYDSPTAGLDPITASNIMEQIIKLRDTRQITALLATHRLQDGFMLAGYTWDQPRSQLRPIRSGSSHTSFLVLRDRRVVFDGSAQELHAARDPYLLNFSATVKTR